MHTNKKLRQDNAASLTVVHQNGSKTVIKPKMTDNTGNRVFDGNWLGLASAIDPYYESYYTV